MIRAEINSTLRRCATVVKSRGSKHEFDSREYVIGQGGITLLPLDESIGEDTPAGKLHRHPQPGAGPFTLAALPLV